MRPSDRGAPETTLATLLAVEWKGFGAFAEEASAAAVEARLERFHALLGEAAEEVGGELVDHAVKARQELRVLAVTGPSAALRCAASLLVALEEAGFSPGLGLHAGECYRRPGGLLGTPIRVAADLAHQAGRDEVLLTEVFRLSSPEGLPELERVDRIMELGGDPWSVWRARSGPGDGGEP